MTSYKNNNYNTNINICQNCEILNTRIICLEYDSKSEELKQENKELKKRKLYKNQRFLYNL